MVTCAMAVQCLLNQSTVFPSPLRSVTEYWTFTHAICLLSSFACCKY